MGMQTGRSFMISRSGKISHKESIIIRKTIITDFYEHEIEKYPFLAAGHDGVRGCGSA